MQKFANDVLHSASDLVNFLECGHITFLDQVNLETPLSRAEDDDQARLIQAKGFEHEADYACELQEKLQSFVDISKVANSLEQRIERTLLEMREGTSVIFQATLRAGRFVGHADFLHRVEIPSALGPFSYEVADTKLSSKVKSKFLIQLSFYTWLVELVQGITPRHMHVVLGSGTNESFRVSDFSRYFHEVRRRYVEYVGQPLAEPAAYPEPREKCAQCRWRLLCEDRRLKDDHLSQVANISRSQTHKLQAAGLNTVKALASAKPDTAFPKLAPEVFQRLQQQALLQCEARESGQRKYVLLPPAQGEVRGFARLPKPSEGDLFFDMEGDPLEDGGLEYLFGLYLFENGKPEFKAFWAHSREEERHAFENFMDFVTARLATHPDAHIYHYAAYEQTALKKLMSLHGTREAAVDNLLRRGTLVDLYKVVKEGIRVSEPRYSIKNIEHFYREAREGDVQNAGASIVFYERWKETGDKKLLDDIERYNFDDVESTYQLREWLLQLRPPSTTWFTSQSGSITDAQTQPGELSEADRRLVPYRTALVEALPQAPQQWGSKEHLRELTYQLLDFHRRADKPVWWAMFNRMDMTADELLDDAESIAGLELDETKPPEQTGRSLLYAYRFPEQETKIKTGDQCIRVDTGDGLGAVMVSHNERTVHIKQSIAKGQLPARLSIGLGGPIKTASLRDAVFRFADSLIRESRDYPAIEALLKRQVPLVKGREQGVALLAEDRDQLPQIIDVISNLDGSYVFVQGPPGAGKTYTGSHVIVALLRAGFRVGVSSNSHKAIHNLLEGVEKVATESGLEFWGVKKSSTRNEDSEFDSRFLSDAKSNDEVGLAINNGARLVAGTAWLFADPVLDRSLDFLFIDEAGQVALANLVAMGVSARNLVLLGDQMQLSQPIQGVHPGRSGDSSLDYLLDGAATISPERGIFLKTTYRMHPAVCSFICDAVYEGRLLPEAANARQQLVLVQGASPWLRTAGIQYVPVEHQGCSQRSPEEAALVVELYANLLQQRFIGKDGVERAMTMENILVIAPYNMQVNLLKERLPKGARVGTVDKFQGQEAEAVIVSMTTSSEEDLPRFIGFLYSKNRLNVALSRAKSLALFLANPALKAIRCNKPEEISLVNTLCWVAEYSDETHREEKCL